ncbi:MAG: YeeE/YedE thiosulfate transporter family protein, partial [Aestuariivirgaceae bacterium]|nr:YeeE/YedE thiosulfate transporter family protein [Aestuariivirgaceae bacterium]
HWAERAAFIAGLIAAPLLVLAATGAPVAQSMPSNFYILGAAGLLVGFGTVLGNGCTSGHSVCGISRLSVRSLVATLTFMATAIITVFLLRHVAGV